ncbi:MAG: (d)CMP kinase [Patescibacteria group bacterium]
MIISIGGTPGSGKSTLAKKIAKKLNWPKYYMGGLRRQAAKKRGVTLAEYNKLGEKNPATDLEVDKYQKKLGKTKDNFIIDGKTSWYFIPHSIKIFIYADPKIGAQRIFKELKKKNHRNEDKKLETLKDVLNSNQKRIKSDNKRYKKFFNINVYNRKNYDFILDTSNLNEKQVFEKVYNYIKKRIDKS